MERQEASGVATKHPPVTTRLLLNGLTRSYPRAAAVPVSAT
jgi:hypothetical protein